MAATSSARSKIRQAKQRFMLLAVAGIVVAGAVGVLAYQSGAQETSRVYADYAYKRAVISSRVAALYHSTRDVTMGAMAPGDLDAIYDNMLTPALAAKLKKDGPAAIFCSDKSPIDMTFGEPSSVTDNGMVLVRENFTVRPFTAVPDKSIIVNYDLASTRLSAITCP